MGMKTSLRDHAATLTGSTAIRMTKADQQDMLTGLRTGTLRRIKAVTEVTHSTKVEKYDRIVEILESHGHDIKSVLMTPTVD